MSFATDSRSRSQPTLPLAGMVDILFLLLVFYTLLLPCWCYMCSLLVLAQHLGALGGMQAPLFWADFGCEAFFMEFESLKYDVRLKFGVVNSMCGHHF